MVVSIGYSQFAVQFGDWEGNAARMTAAVAAHPGADLLVFPELATTGYEFVDAAEVAAHAEPFGEGPTSRLMLDLARQYDATLVAGYAERAGEACFNACMLATPTGALHNYRKIHLFNREKALFTPGDAPPPVLDTPRRPRGPHDLLRLVLPRDRPESCPARSPDHRPPVEPGASLVPAGHVRPKRGEPCVHHHRQPNWR